MALKVRALTKSQGGVLHLGSAVATPSSESQWQEPVQPPEVGGRLCSPYAEGRQTNGVVFCSLGTPGTKLCAIPETAKRRHQGSRSVNPNRACYVLCFYGIALTGLLAAGRHRPQATSSQPSRQDAGQPLQVRNQEMGTNRFGETRGM